MKKLLCMVLTLMMVIQPTAFAVPAAVEAFNEANEEVMPENHLQSNAVEIHNESEAMDVIPVIKESQARQELDENNVELSESYSGTCGDNLTWVLNGDTLTISGEGDMWDYSFDRDYPSMWVYSNAPWYNYIGEMAEMWHGFTKLIIEEGVTSIGKAAFSGCYIKSVEIPDSVTSICEDAFYEASFASASNVEIPAGVKNIGNYAFYYSSLYNLTIQNGVESIGDKAFGMTNFESLEIPSSVTSLGNGAFDYCQKLKSITIPDSVKISGSIFVGCYSLENITVVETDSENKYITSVDGVLFDNKLEALICFPGNNANTHYTIPNTVTSIGNYAFYGCSALQSISIPNTVTSISKTAFSGCSEDFAIYCFPGSYAEEWAIANGVGYIFEEDNSIYLETVNESGTIISDGYTVNWYEKGNDKIIAIGTQLSGIETGKTYEYEIVLDEALVKEYILPEIQEVSVTDETESPIKLTYTLQKTPQITIYGKITDNTGNPLSGVTIKSTQKINEKYEKTDAVTTDEHGNYSMTIAKVYANISCSLFGYYDKTIALTDHIEATNAEYDIGTTMLYSMPSDKITLSLSKTVSVMATDTAYSQSVTTFNGLEFSIFDVTQNKNVTGFTAQYPNIVIEDSFVKGNDVIRIHATDKNNTMTADPIEITLSDLKLGNGEIVFTENGRITIDSIDSDNEAIAMLFDGKDAFVKSYSAYSGFKTDTLVAGNYSLALMEKTSLLRSVANIGRLSELGLEEGTDYILFDLEVQNGTISVIDEAAVPRFNESKLYYTVSENTYFTANNSTATVGRYIIMRAEYEIDEKYNSSNQYVTIEIPENVEFAEDSLTLNNVKTPYNFSNNELTVITNDKTGIIRFYVYATDSGKHNLNAYLGFEKGGENVIQPIGTAGFVAENDKVYAPEKTAQKTITVTGSALSDSIITLYDNAQVVGTTVANKVGKWSLTYDLINPYSYLYHQIYANIYNPKNGTDIQTDESLLLYKEYYAEVSKITMIIDSDVCVFDFLNPSSTPSYSLLVVPGKFNFVSTFKLEFTGESTTTIRDVYVVTENNLGESTYIPVTYDEKTGMWLGTFTFSLSNVPVKVNAVWGETTSTSPVDRENLDAIYLEYAEEKEYEENLDKLSGEIDDAQKTLRDAEESGDLDEIFKAQDDYLDKLISFYSDSNRLDTPDSTTEDDSYVPPEADKEKINSMSPDEWKEYTDSLVKNYNNAVDKLDKTVKELEKKQAEIQQESEKLLGSVPNVTTQTADDLDHDTLIDQGFEKIETTADSSSTPSSNGVYIRNSGNSSEYVDLNNNVHITISNINGPDFKEPTGSSDVMDNINSAVNYSSLTLEGAKGLAERIIADEKQINDMIKSAKNAMKDALEYQDHLYKNFKIRAENYAEDVSTYIKELGKAEYNYNYSKNLLKSNLNALAKTKTALRNFIKGAGRIGSLFGTAFAYISILLDVLDYIDKIDNLRALLKQCPDSPEAEALESQIDALIFEINAYVLANSAVTLATLVPGVGTLASIGIGVLQIAAGEAFSNHVESNFSSMKNDARMLGCIPEKALEEQIFTPVGCWQSATPIIDPSGYVYEAVPSNRVEGVKAEIYYYDYPIDEFGMPGEVKEDILWNAQEYDQVNPLYTDANGMYAWDVPTGLWLVKFTKEGYYDADSRNDRAAVDGYLPVPPPQVDVNTAIVSKAAPSIKNINVYEDEIQIIFSQYMQLDSINSTNVVFRQNGSIVNGIIKPVNAEFNYEETEQFASIFKFTPSASLSGSVDAEIKDVKNYAGTTMEATFTAEKEVVFQPKSIEVRSSVSVKYGNSVSLEIGILPAEASKNMTVNLSSTSPSIAVPNVQSVTTDENGKAKIELDCLLPGQADILLELSGTDITAKTSVYIYMEASGDVGRCENVTADIGSGSYVNKGTFVTLETSTKGAEIYYTLDGSCPCIEDNTARIKYTNPIEITSSCYIIAYAVKDGYEDSSTKAFKYTLIGDINLDGFVSIDDAVFLFQHSMMPKLYPISYARNIDYNNDGILNIDDAVLLFQHSMMPSIYPID